MEVTALKSNVEVKQPTDKMKPLDDIFNELFASLFANIKVFSMQQTPAGVNLEKSNENVQKTDAAKGNISLLNNLMTVINQLKLNSIKPNSDMEKLMTMLEGKTNKTGSKNAAIANNSSIEKLIDMIENEKGSQAIKNNEVNDNSSLSGLEKLIDILQNNEDKLSPDQSSQILNSLLNENNASGNIDNKAMTEIQNITNKNTNADNSKEINTRNIAEMIQKAINENSSIKNQDNSIKTNIKDNVLKINKGQIAAGSNETELSGEKNKDLAKVNKSLGLIADIKKDDAAVNDKIQTNITSAAVKNETAEIKMPEENAVISKNSDIVEVAVEKFKSLRLPDITELKVKLVPRELGEITVKLVLEKGQINGNIIATKKETAEVLQNQITTLKHNLEENNIQLSNLSINLKNEDNYNGRHSNQKYQNDNRKNSKDATETFEDAINEVSDNNINLIA